MLGDFINRCLILLLGYAYPGFECYKTVEKNRVDIEELRFWCKYWIIVALFTVLEKFADIFLAWIPMYGETKLILFVYMWYPKTKGTGYIYETVLRPCISRHENEIDRKLLEWRARAWDYVIFYWQYCAQFGHSAFLMALQQLATQSTKIIPTPAATQKNVNDAQVQTAAAEMTVKQASFQMKQNSTLSKSKKWPPSPPTSPTATTNTIHRSSSTISETPKSKTMHQVPVDHSSSEEYLEEEEALMDPEPVTLDQEVKDDEQRVGVSVRDRINRARARLRRLDSSQTPKTPRTPQKRQQ